MMQKMMDSMVKSMSIDEREQMMLKMMPEMMKKADMHILMPNMLEMMGRQVSLNALVSFIVKVTKEEELKSVVSEKGKRMKETMPDMMGQLMPVMKPMMKSIMPKMMGTMMPVMSQVMGDEKECIMADMVDENPELGIHMGEMMSKMCPTMAGKVIPEGKRKTFIKEMIEKVITEHEVDFSEEEFTSILSSELQ